MHSVKELLCLVTELWEEVRRLRSIRDREKERHRLLESHPAFHETASQAGRMQDDSLSTLHLAEHSDLRLGGYGNKFLPSAAGVSPL